MKGCITSVVRIATIAMLALLAPFAYAQISISHVDDGSWPCGWLRVVSTNGHDWDITIYYSVTGQDGQGRRAASDRSSNVRVSPNSTNRTVISSGPVDCNRPYAVGSTTWTGKDVTNAEESRQREQQRERQLYQDREDAALRRIIEREEQKRRDAELALRQRQEAEHQRLAAIANAEKIEQENYQRLLRDTKARDAQEKQNSLDRFDREMSDLQRGTNCGIGRSLPGSDVSRETVRRAVELCVQNSNRDRAKAEAEASGKRAKAADELARYNDYQQDMARREAENRQQEILRQQREAVRQRQIAQEVERARAQRQAAAVADLDNVLAKEAATTAERISKTQDLKKSNSNLADLINSLK